MKFLIPLFSLASTSVSLALDKAYFAGGCFWCMEAPFEKEPGVLSVISGFTGGHKPSPSYKDVSNGQTGHTEAIEILFDSNKTSYTRLLEIFWRQVDPTDNKGQFVDRGYQYRPGIFYVNDQQKTLAEKSRDELVRKKIFNCPLTIEITRFKSFHPAENYHQDYYKKNPLRYHYYRYRSGRDQFLEKAWNSKLPPCKKAKKD